MEDYREKYVKYKNKYLELKKELHNLYGGDYDKSLIEFIKSNYNNSSEIFFYLRNKFAKVITFENLDEFINYCLPNIKILMEFLYSKLSDESKIKPELSILSYATGSATVEALFGIYLKEIHNKTVKLIYVDPINNDVLINTYNIFSTITNIYYVKMLPTQLSLILSGKSNPKLLPRLIELYNFDIFMTNNPQNYIYDDILAKFNTYEDFRNSEYYRDEKYNGKYRGMPSDFFYDNQKQNYKLKLIYNLINIIKHPEEQIRTPMLWLLWENEINLTSIATIETSTRAILQQERKQNKWKIPEEYAISTIDNINKIFRIYDI